MTAFQASGTDSLSLDQYFSTFWFLIYKFLSLLGRAWVPKVPIATTPMISGIGILLLLDTSFNISNGSKILYFMMFKCLYLFIIPLVALDFKSTRIETFV